MTKAILIGAISLAACDGGDGGVGTTDAAIEVEVDGEPVGFDAGQVVLCSEGLPDDLYLSVLRTTRDDGGDCPELFMIGGAGVEISRGRICDELYVQLIGVTTGDPIEARGSTSALLAFYRHADGESSVSTGDTGSRPDAATGSVTIDAFESEGANYRIRFSVEIDGSFDVSASGEVVATPEFCTSA